MFCLLSQGSSSIYLQKSDLVFILFQLLIMVVCIDAIVLISNILQVELVIIRHRSWLEINSWIDTCWLIRALICNLMKTISLPYPEELYSSWFPFTILSSFVILVFYYTYSYLKFPPTSPKINLVSIHKNKYCSYITVNGQYFIATLYEIKKKIT